MEKQSEIKILHRLLRQLEKNNTNHPISSNSHSSATANKAIHCLKWGEGGGGGTKPTGTSYNLDKNEAVHPTAVSGNYSSSGLLAIENINKLMQYNSQPSLTTNNVRHRITGVLCVRQLIKWCTGQLFRRIIPHEDCCWFVVLRHIQQF